MTGLRGAGLPAETIEKSGSMYSMKSDAAARIAALRSHGQQLQSNKCGVRVPCPSEVCISIESGQTLAEIGDKRHGEPSSHNKEAKNNPEHKNRRDAQYQSSRKKRKRDVRDSSNISHECTANGTKGRRVKLAANSWHVAAVRQTLISACSSKHHARARADFSRDVKLARGRSRSSSSAGPLLSDSSSRPSRGVKHVRSSCSGSSSSSRADTSCSSRRSSGGFSLEFDKDLFDAADRCENTSSKRQMKDESFSCEAKSDALDNWLLSLDGGEGSMLCFSEKLHEEFENVQQVAACAASKVRPEGSSALQAVNNLLFEVLGVESLGQRLLLAKGVATLRTQYEE